MGMRQPENILRRSSNRTSQDCRLYFWVTLVMHGPLHQWRHSRSLTLAYSFCYHCYIVSQIPFSHWEVFSFIILLVGPRYSLTPNSSLPKTLSNSLRLWFWKIYKIEMEKRRQKQYAYYHADLVARLCISHALSFLVKSPNMILGSGHIPRIHVQQEVVGHLGQSYHYYYYYIW